MADTRSSTFRLDSDTLEALQYEANKRRISPNMLVNQILDKFVNWDSASLEADFIPLPRSLLITVFNSLTEKQISELAKKHVEDDLVNILLEIKTSATTDDFMSVLESWIRDSGMNYRHTVKGALHTHVIQHDMGEKWSLFMGEVCRLAYEKLGQKRIKAEMSENNVVLTIGKPPPSERQFVII